MADVVQFKLERMLNELDDLERRGLFSRREIAEIVKKRRKFEYRLKRPSPLKEDFLAYIDYEKQVDALRSLRKKALERKSGGGKLKKSVSDHSCVARILDIYRLATNRFKGDIELWFQYLEYCRARGHGRMNKALAQLVRFHPKVPGVWIYAAAWQFDNNLNVEAARALMQNGLRSCPTSEDLWIEYLRMELTYLNKLRARKIALGEAKENTLSDRRKGDEQQWRDENKELFMSLDENGDADKKSCSQDGDSEGKTDAFREQSLNVLEAVYSGAIDALPVSFSLRTRFLAILEGTELVYSEDMRKRILDDMKRDFSKEPHYWDWLARAEMKDSKGVNSLQLGKAVQVYEEGLKFVPSSSMIELYLKFLMEAINDENKDGEAVIHFSSSVPAVEVVSHILEVFKKAESLDCLTEDLASHHLSFLLNLGKLDEAKTLTEKFCSGKFSDAVSLWTLRLTIEMRSIQSRSPSPSKDDLICVFELLKNVLMKVKVSEAENLWIMGLKYFANQRHHFDKLVEMSLLLLAKDGGSNSGFSLSSTVLNFILQRDGLEKAREMYKSGIITNGIRAVDPRTRDDGVSIGKNPFQRHVDDFLLKFREILDRRQEQLMAAYDEMTSRQSSQLAVTKKEIEADYDGADAKIQQNFEEEASDNVEHQLFDKMPGSKLKDLDETEVVETKDATTYIIGDGSDMNFYDQSDELRWPITIPGDGDNERKFDENIEDGNESNGVVWIQHQVVVETPKIDERYVFDENPELEMKVLYTKTESPFIKEFAKAEKQKVFDEMPESKTKSKEPRSEVFCEMLGSEHIKWEPGGRHICGSAQNTTISEVNSNVQEEVIKEDINQVFDQIPKSDKKIVCASGVVDSRIEVQLEDESEFCVAISHTQQLVHVGAPKFKPSSLLHCNPQVEVELTLENESIGVEELSPNDVLPSRLTHNINMLQPLEEDHIFRQKLHDQAFAQWAEEPLGHDIMYGSGGEGMHAMFWICLHGFILSSVTTLRILWRLNQGKGVYRVNIGGYYFDVFTSSSLVVAYAMGQLKELEGKELMFVTKEGLKLDEKKIKELSHEWDLVNKQKPVRMRKPEEVTKEDYAAFYKSLTNDWEEHLAVKHFSVEGHLEFKTIFLVPKRAAVDFLDNKKKPNNIKVYVRHVFIKYNYEQEMLQQNKILRVICENLVTRCIELLFEIAENREDYNKFYEAFSRNLKLGIHEDSQNKRKISELLRYHLTKSGDEMSSLKDYVTGMKEGQNDILLYITGESRKAIENSSFLEKLKKGYEVLIMVNAIDDYAVDKWNDCDDKKLVLATKEEGYDVLRDVHYLLNLLNSITHKFELSKVIFSHIDFLGHILYAFILDKFAWSLKESHVLFNYAKLSKKMLSDKWFVLHIANSNDIMHLGACGLHELVFYDILLMRWGLFGDVAQKPQIQCKFLWLRRFVVVDYHVKFSNTYGLISCSREHFVQGQLPEHCIPRNDGIELFELSVSARVPGSVALGLSCIYLLHFVCITRCYVFDRALQHMSREDTTLSGAEYCHGHECLKERKINTFWAVFVYSSF